MQRSSGEILTRRTVIPTLQVGSLGNSASALVLDRANAIAAKHAKSSPGDSPPEGHARLCNNRGTAATGGGGAAGPEAAGGSADSSNNGLLSESSRAARVAANFSNNFSEPRVRAHSYSALPSQTPRGQFPGTESGSDSGASSPYSQRLPRSKSTGRMSARGGRHSARDAIDEGLLAAANAASFVRLEQKMGDQDEALQALQRQLGALTSGLDRLVAHSGLS